MAGRFRSTVSLVGLLVMAVCGDASATEKLSVRDSWSVSGLQAGWYWAMEKGLFAKNGVEISFEDGNGSSTTVQLINAGQFDVGHADLSVMSIGRGKGMKLVSVGGLIQKTSIGVFFPKASGVKTPKDLEGKEVIYTATSFEGPFIDPFLKAAGTSRDQVKLVSVDAASKIPSYAAGRGDAMIISIPFGMAYVQKTRPSDHILFGDYGLDLPSYGLVVNESTLKSRGDAIKGLAKAYFEAWRQIIDGGEAAYDEAASILIKRRPDAKLDREQLVTSVREHIKYFKTPNTASLPLGFQSEEDWKRVVATLEKANLIPAGSKPGDYFTNALLESASQ
jgi:NitT/TauT family transport system substrate-binding protein